jgi:hypothetical protein
MHKLFFTLGLSILFITMSLHVSAASLVLNAPEGASTNGEPFTVSVSLNGEGSVVSAVGGVLSFDSDLLAVDSIVTRSSIVSLWVNQPRVLDESYKDGKTRIAFEGIIPGGFSGVRSPYYDGVHPGIVFFVTMRPKKEGIATFLLDQIELHAFDKDGTILPSEPKTTQMTIPMQSIVYVSGEKEVTEVKSNTLIVTVDQDPLIAKNSSYLVVNEDQSIRPINHILVAESDAYDVHDVLENDWHVADGPYILTDQKRTKYIHVKVFYENKTFTVQTIPPVEKSHQYRYLSRILIGIAILALFFYRYGTYYKKLFSKYFYKK